MQSRAGATSSNLAARAGRWSGERRKTPIWGWTTLVVLAVANAIDATVIRAVLPPAAMNLLGDRNWYLPRSPRWLPRVGDREPEPNGARA